MHAASAAVEGAASAAAEAAASDDAGAGRGATDRAAAEMAARQHGVLSMRQAREAGLRERQVRYRVQSGRWVRVAAGAYRVAGAVRTWRSDVMAAVLLAGHGDATRAAASHATALHLLDAARFPRPPQIEVSVEWGRRVVGGEAAVHHVRDLDADVVTIDGIPCTSGVRTTIDRAAVLDEHPLTALVDDVVCAGLAGRSALHARCGSLARGRGGVDVVCALTAPGAAAVFRSILEREGAAALDAGGLPVRETNVVVADARGRVREVDVLFRDARLVVEWDGLRFHASAAQRRRDRAGDRRLVIAGYRVLRFEWLDVRTRPGTVAEEVRAALAR